METRSLALALSLVVALFLVLGIGTLSSLGRLGAATAGPTPDADDPDGQGIITIIADDARVEVPSATATLDEHAPAGGRVTPTPPHAR